MVDFIRKCVNDYGFRGAVLGVSGGIDSAVVLGLLIRALDRDRILALILPERDSSKRSLRDAQRVCKHFGVVPQVYSITGALRALGAYKLFPPAFLIPEKLKQIYARNRWNRYEDPYIMDLLNEGDELFLKGLAYYRVKHRVRMCKLYMEAEKRKYCVVGTTNRTEQLLGLYVKWGDDSVDIEPIMHLYKVEVYEMAKYLGVPTYIIEKAPTPDLVPGIVDEEAFGLTYAEIDSILMDLEKGIEREGPAVERIKKIITSTKLRELKCLHLERGE
ncbi:NAD(+) synthetase [Fervidobacterium thailandense]|uniref:NH(3)-dependent NAD(+) synthetase n=1 Tax=Fervidobacterium thailandense TaxID=1008305 RepID=A0A1E3G2H9_9BACT|nr:NAD(+) synthetase [Fervidobacterium thailandense]